MVRSFITRVLYSFSMKKEHHVALKNLHSFKFAHIILLSISLPLPGSAILSFGYSVGSGPIFLDQLACSGAEQSLLSCSSGRPVGLHQCNYTMDVGLKCQGG